MSGAEENRRDHTFHINILGRTLEHFGSQMYKRRDTAIAELVANSWDAGAENVYITVPEAKDYDPASSVIRVRDDGSGMDKNGVQEDYLVIGRNRRQHGPDTVNGRPVIGRKGIGKLAGFGIAYSMMIATWKGNREVVFTLNLEDLKKEDDQVGNVPIPGSLGSAEERPTTNGTEVTLKQLKHSSAVDIEKLRESLARRFSRTIRGQMTIQVNGRAVEEPDLELYDRVPAQGVIDDQIDFLGEKQTVRYFYGFTKKPIRSRELRGFTLHVRGKTVQAPPFFFFVEATASGQHGTKYLTGAIEADFLDEKPGDDDDFISTDRQEIDWEASEIKPLLDWGDRLTRGALRSWAAGKSKKLQEWILEDPDLRNRIDRLDKPSQSQIMSSLRSLSKVEDETEDARRLADSLVQAYEFRQFHNCVQTIENVSDDPEALRDLLVHLRDWEVLESRAILEIIRGRLGMIDKFHTMIVDDTPETAPKTGADNLHDMLGRYPWLLNPDWQMLAEEKAMSTQLKEWHCEDIEPEDERRRYDFLALANERLLVVVEIKRSGHAVVLRDLQRLEEYRDRLSKGTERQLHMLMVCGGHNLSAQTEENWETRPDGDIVKWSQVFERVKQRYNHYRAVLERSIDSPEFSRKEQEVADTRSVLEAGSSYRGPDVRAQGLGPQDVEHKPSEDEDG